METEKCVILIALIIVALLHGYSMYDLWSYNYENIPDFLKEYSLIGVPMFLIFLRVVAVEKTGTLGVWLFSVMGISVYLVISGILWKAASEAVWIFGIDALVLYLGAFISLFIGGGREGHDSERE